MYKYWTKNKQKNKADFQNFKTIDVIYDKFGEFMTT